MTDEMESMLPRWLQEGAGPRVITCVYIAAVTLIALGGYISWHMPLLGIPFVLLATGFLVAWYFFEHEYRSFNLQMQGKGVSANLPQAQGDAQGEKTDENKNNLAADQ